MFAGHWMLLALLPILCESTNRVNYDRYRVYRVTPHNEEHLALLRTIAASFDTWKEPRSVGDPVDIMLDEHHQTLLPALLEIRGIQHEVLISDVGQLINAERHNWRRSLKGNRLPDFEYDRYHDLDELYQWITDQQAAHPDKITVTEITKSFEDRPINVMKISTGGTGKPGIWLDAGIHSREWVSVGALIFMVNQLLTQYGVDSEVTALLDNVDWYVVPIFNVDGYSYTWTTDRLWRKTRSINEGSECRGCDPNRNWDIMWNTIGTSSNPCSNIFAGPSAFSEVEVREVANYVSRLPDIKMYMAYHSYGQMYMTPYGYSLDDPPDFADMMAVCNTAVDKLREVHGMTYVCDSLINLVGPNSGSSADYAYANLTIKYSFGVELRDNGTYGFVLPPEQIVPTGEENFAALKEFGKHIMNEFL